MSKNDLWRDRKDELLAIFANNYRSEVAVAKRWVGLTEDDLKEALAKSCGWSEFAQFLEQRLKIRNGYDTTNN